MATRTRKPKTIDLRTPAQRRAIDSPLRIEILSLFVDPAPLSVAEMAERMGRPATALHYHVRILEQAGLLKRAGQRHSARRPQAVYRPVADIFTIERKKGDQEDVARTALRAMGNAFRMAERDMKAALVDPTAQSTGPQRNLLGARAHCRLAPKDLAALNRHLQKIQDLLFRIRQNHRPSPDDLFISLTVALTPLRNREVIR